MRVFLLFIFLFFIAICDIESSDIFSDISKSSWVNLNGQTFSGEQIVFLKSNNGSLKSIRQIFGSGVYVIGNELYDVKIKGDTIFLINDLPKSDQKGISVKYLLYSSDNNCLTDNRNVQFSPRELVIFNWLGNYIKGEKVSVEKAIEMISNKE